MSLLEKLGQKRVQKDQLQQEALIQEKKQNFEQLNQQVLSLTEKKQRINNLKLSLRQHYGMGAEDLTRFKNQKEQLKNAFEENRDILAEEGVNDFEEMLEINANEPEVRSYRRAGGRAPSRIEGAKASSDEAGETGKLYKTVGGIKEIKDTLQAEMPEIKLNFSAVTKKDEDLSNREQSFIQIDQYLESLDKQIAELNKQKEEAYLKTPEGIKRALNNIQSPDHVFRDQEPDRLNYFEVRDEVLALSEKVGLEPIKDIYAEALGKNLEKRALSKKTTKEKEAIDHYPGLKKISELGYNLPELDNIKQEYRQAVEKIAALLDKDKAKAESLIGFGLSGDNLYDNWETENQKLADAFIKHTSHMAGLNNPEQLKKSVEGTEERLRQLKGGSFTNYSNFRELQTPEFFRYQSNQYSKFLDYIQNSAEGNSLVSADRKENSLLNLARNSENFSDPKMEKPEESIKIPLEFIRNNGGFREAHEMAELENGKWEKTKASIGKVSKAAVDFRFAQAQERYLARKDKTILDAIGYERGLKTKLSEAVSYLNHNEALHDPELSIKRIKIKANDFGSAKILEADSEHSAVYDPLLKNNKEIESFAKERIDALEISINKLRTATIVMGRSAKINKLNSQINVFRNFKNNVPLKEQELIALGILPEEITAMKALRETKDKLDKDYKHYDQNRIRFFQSLDSGRHLNIDIKSSDILNGQEMAFKELPERLQARINEAEAYLTNLPEKEKTVLEKTEQALKSLTEKTTIFERTIADNLQLIKELR